MGEKSPATLQYHASYGSGKSIWVFDRSPRLRDTATFARRECPEFESAGLVDSPDGFCLERDAREGWIDTGPVEAPSFDWLAPWWNIDVSGTGNCAVYLQFMTPDGWSRRYAMGLWSHTSRSFRDQDGAARVDVDTLRLSAPSTCFRCRLVLSSGSGEPGLGAVMLHRFGVLTRTVGAARPPARPYLLQTSSIRVPARSQMTEEKSVRTRLGSPASVGMALESLGINIPTRHVAADCYDFGAGIYSNRPFNVGSMWRLGLRARLDYFPNMEMASAELFSGKAFIAHIASGEDGDADDSAGRAADRLVVVRGLEKDAKGGISVLVNDPAARSEESVPSSYSLERFEKIWTGVAYVAEGRR